MQMTTQCCSPQDYQIHIQNQKEAQQRQNRLELLALWWFWDYADALPCEIELDEQFPP